MSQKYCHDLLKISVVKMLQTIGWHSINTTPLEILTDVLSQYLSQLAKTTNEYANEFGIIEPNLDHLGLAFRDFHVNLSDLEEYVTYVNFGQGPTAVPKFPLPKEDHLNFLKPGSKEVVTRPVYIHEHLPPMYPLLEAAENENDVTVKNEAVEEGTSENSTPVFKKPAEISPGDTFKKPRLLLEDEGRPTRELSSVIMTTSGFLSPAREGKLPESRTPLAATEPSPVAPTPVTPVDALRKPNKIVKKVEKRKERFGKELFRIDEKLRKSIPAMKDAVRMKQLKTAATTNVVNNGLPPSNFMLNNELRISPIPANKSPQQSMKLNKALVAARQKTEKLNTTITPIPMKPMAGPMQNTLEHIKLFTEPDKKKINILKKISNVKNEKPEKAIRIKEEIKQESRESSPDLVIDESVEPAPKIHHISNDITIELIPTQPAPPPAYIEKVEKPYFEDESPPGTPSTPRTPEMITQSPPLNRGEKRKRKDKSKVKKVQKFSPSRIESEPMDIEMDRPKTPEAQVLVKHEPQQVSNPASALPFLFPLTNFGGPGLIPPPLNNSLYPLGGFPPLMHGFGQAPYIPPPHPALSMNFIQPKVEPPVKAPEKPPVIANIPKAPLSPKQEKKPKEHKKEKKEKIKKKNKKDKLKNKAEKKKLKEEKKDKDKVKKEKKEKKKDKESWETDITVPKLTLKLGSSSPCPDNQDTRKLNIKPVIKKEESETPAAEPVREQTPELAKISALVTGQPKPKAPAPPPPPTSDTFPTSSSDSFHNLMRKSMFKSIPKIRKKETHVEPSIELGLSNITPSKYLDEAVKEETAVPSTASCRVNHGPGRPRIHPIKTKPTKAASKHQIPIKDAEGKEVWICPACLKQDDGSPMIGCDDCDAWYHWVCVGIQIPPDDNEDWYCRHCLAKKQEALASDKKKKRKKKEKKDH